jgi:hypothetical protein
MTFNFFDKSDHDLEPPDDLLESAPDPPVMETSGTGDQCDPAQHRGIVLTFYGDRPAIDRDIYRSDLISAEVWAIRLVASCSIDDRLQQRQDQPLFIKLTTEPGPDCDRHPSSQSATHSIRIDLYLTPDRLRQFDLRPLELWPLLEQAAVALRPTGDRLVTALQLVLQQMVCCSFEGAMRQMYLESKSVELLIAIGSIKRGIFCCELSKTPRPSRNWRTRWG